MSIPKLETVQNEPFYAWFFAITAPMLLLNDNSELNEIWMYESNKNRTLEESREGIDESWGIKSRQEHIETINRLINLDVHGHGIRDAFDRIAFSGPQELDEVEQRMTDEQQRNEFRYHRMTYDLVGDARFFGFDLARASFLTRHATILQWLSEEEVLFYLSVIAHRIQQLFPDWDTYHKSYILGRNWWCYTVEDYGPELILNKGDFGGFNAFFQCLTQPRAPVWSSLPFDMVLPRYEAPSSLYEQEQEQEESEA